MSRPSKKREVICGVCDKKFYVSASQSHRKFCSKSCMGVAFTGENNPNHGNAWSQDQRKRQSSLIKSKVDVDYRIKAGSANRGKRFDIDRIERMHRNRASSSYSRKHTEQSKQLIGQKSKAKFTKEYRERVKQKMILSGVWIPDHLRTDLELYRIKANWIAGMWDIAENQQLLSEVGVYNRLTNRSGCVRDHMLSKQDGYKLGLFPEILRHPANCQLLTHSENSRKRERSVLTPDELFDKIRKYEKHWIEQSLVIELITKWIAGERYMGGGVICPMSF